MRIDYELISFMRVKFSINTTLFFLLRVNYVLKLCKLSFLSTLHTFFLLRLNYELKSFMQVKFSVNITHFFLLRVNYELESFM